MTLIGPYLLPWRHSVSLNTWRHQGPHKPSSCTTFTLNSPWGRAATDQKKKKVLSLCMQGRFSPVLSDSLQPCRLWPARLLCQRGVSPGKNTGVYCPVLVAIPFSLQFSSVAQSCPTFCDPMNRSTPGLPVHHQLPELTQTHVYRVDEAVQPSHPLSSTSPPAPNPSQHQSLFQ